MILCPLLCWGHNAILLICDLQISRSSQVQKFKIAPKETQKCSTQTRPIQYFKTMTCAQPQNAIPGPMRTDLLFYIPDLNQAEKHSTSTNVTADWKHRFGQH